MIDNCCNEASCRNEYFKVITYSGMCCGLDGFNFTSAKETDNSLKHL